MTITLAARHDRCDALQADRMTLAGATSKVLIGQPKGPQEPPLRSLCGPACREQPGTGENSLRQASAFTRGFPRVAGCARSTNESGMKEQVGFPMRFSGLLRSFCGPNSAVDTAGCVARRSTGALALLRDPPRTTILQNV